MTSTTRPGRFARTARFLAPAILIGALLISALLVAAPASAQPERHAQLCDFVLSGKFDLHVRSEIVSDAQLYHAERASTYLVLADAFDQKPILVNIRTRTVTRVSPEDLCECEDADSIDIRAGAKLERMSSLGRQGRNMTFTVDGVSAYLAPRPPLRGTHWSSAVVAHSPQYGRAARLYRPDVAAMKQLSESKTEARIQIFFGTWCPFCNRFLPNTLKVEEELKKNGTNLSFEFHGLPNPPAAWVTREAQKYRVRKLPTGLVFIDNRQVGRLEGNDWIHPEVALIQILK